MRTELRTHDALPLQKLRNSHSVRCFLILAIGLSWADLCAADQLYSVQFIPAKPIVGQTIVARVSDVSGPSCLPGGYASVDRTVLNLQLAYTDYCDSYRPVAYRDYVLGSPPQGRYAFTIEVCFSNPPPFPSGCTIGFVGSLVVKPLVRAVPSIAPWGMLLLSALILFASLKKANRRLLEDKERQISCRTCGYLGERKLPCRPCAKDRA